MNWTIATYEKFDDIECNNDTRTKPESLSKCISVINKYKSFNIKKN